MVYLRSTLDRSLKWKTFHRLSWYNKETVDYEENAKIQAGNGAKRSIDGYKKIADVARQTTQAKSSACRKN